MNILEVFFWYCKSMGIMKDIWEIYHHKWFGLWKFDVKTSTSYFGKYFLIKHLEEYCRLGGISQVFLGIEKCCRNGLYLKMRAEKVKKAKRNWGRFIKNNLIISPSFVKEGDKIEVDTINGIIDGVVDKIANDKMIFVIGSNSERILVSPFQKIKINGETRTPKFLIKKNRKFYGIDKE